MVKHNTIYCKVLGFLLLYWVMIHLPAVQAKTVEVSTSAELVRAVNYGSVGDVVVLGPGIYTLSATQRLIPKDGMTIRGAGIDRTTIKPAHTWDPGESGLPNETNANKAVREAFLFTMDNTKGVTISDVTTRADQLHGHMLLVASRGTTIARVKFIGSRWVGIQSFQQRNIVVHNCVFEDAGGTVRWKGGSIFQTGTDGGEYYNNHIYRTGDKRYVGFKARGSEKHVRIHHNTVDIGDDFSLEWPHESCHFIEIDHNMFRMTMSIPKWQGGTIPLGGYTFWIHHNWLRRSYAIELARNGLLVDHNLFDFAPEADYGNLLCDFGDQPVGGPLVFHNNRVKNPGRGLFWHKDQAIYREFYFHNNEVKAHTTATPRLDGLFGLSSPHNHYPSIVIKDNIIECIGTARPLFRKDHSYAAVVANNTLINVSDSKRLDNPDTGAPRGLTAPLRFHCGVQGQFAVDGWQGGPSDTGNEHASEPAAPSGLRARVVSGNEVELSWTDHAEHEEGFKLERRIGAGPFEPLGGGTGPDITRFQDLHLRAGIGYTYRVRAFNSYGQSAYSNEASIVTSAGALGSITYEVWDGIEGQAVADLTSHPNYPDKPTTTSSRPRFEAPTDWGHNYGQRMHGYLHIATSGTYRFYLAGDNNTELWLSTDTDPAHAQKIAEVRDWTKERQWDKFASQKSRPIDLVAGKKYYILALHKQGSGGDNLAVGWEVPSKVGIQVIPGDVLSQL